MQSLQQQLTIYQNQHATQTSKTMHYVGISAIIIALLILLNWFILDIFARWHINLAWLLVIGTVVYYFLLQWRLAILTTIVLLIITAIVSWLVPPTPTKASIIIFFILLVGGGILQYS